MRTIIVSAITLLLAFEAAADGKLMKYRGLSHYTYDYQTGELSRVEEPDTRHFRVVWDITETTGYFTSLGARNMGGVWGDIYPPAGDITTFQIGYATNACWEPNNSLGPIGVEIVFYNHDNGRGDLDVTLNAEFVINGLPGSPFCDYNFPNNIGLGFVVDVTGFTPFNMRASADEDTDGLPGTGSVDPNDPFYDPLWNGCVDDAVNGFGGYLDFGYTYLYSTQARGVVGTILTQPGEPNMPCTAPGATNRFDLYKEDPNNPVDPNKIVHKAELGDSQAWFYSGTFWFGENPFSGFYLTLSSGVACDNPACDGADINADCVVDLADLAIQLGNFATPGGADFADGDVDLTDLAVMLSFFGAVCR